MSLQRLHTLEIPRRPHYASRLLPAPTLHRPIEPSAHQKLPGFIEPQIRNHISVRRHRINRLLPPQIPHLDRVVVAPRRQLPFTAVLGPTWNPFGANRQQSMPFACPCASASARFSLPTCRTSALRPDRRSHSRHTPDWSQVAARLPSRWKDRPMTSRAWPSWRRSWFPVSTSQRRKEESRETVPTKRPGGEGGVKRGTGGVEGHGADAIDVAGERVDEMRMIIDDAPELGRF